MRWKKLDPGRPAIYAVVLATGDKVVSELGRFVHEQKIDVGALTAIGAFQNAILGYFDWEMQDYKRIPVEEQVEVLSLIGDVAVSEGDPTLHMHLVLGKRDGTTVGGHLLEGMVRPTLEITLTEPPGYLRKRKDPETGLALIDLDRS
jgi:hypothetical protein